MLSLCLLPRPAALFVVIALLFVPMHLACGLTQEESKTEKQEMQEEEQANQQEKPKHTNKLVDETSPYLLMHAHNPVNWYPWGEEALKKAQDENKPIFLSIGYSSCHWCHVMERESFLDEEIAKFLNDNFVCIKVDREERPDIDSIYMTALQVFNQLTRNRRGGGWPLTMFMTPDGRPFFGGTYFPARDGDRGSMPGFLTLAQRVNAAWTERRDRVLVDAERLTEVTRAELSGRRDKEPVPLEAAWVKECQDELQSRFDPQYGGFGFNEANPNIPKFPQASNLFFLLSELRKNPANEDARRFLEVTLDKMFQGGIYDHVGGGFHRYSVDRFWHIPHFEKMLYDNGQLLSVYAEALQFLPKDEYRQVCNETAAFVLREMTAENGGFYSALDAESEGEEGKFYRWEKDEMKKALSGEQFEKYAGIYRINEEPNFEEKYYSPQLSQSLKKTANDTGQSLGDLQAELRSLNDILLKVRAQREQPLLDSKILTSWNGMMIRGLADAGRVLKNEEYTKAAAKAADFLWENSMIDGRLKRTFTANEARLNAYLDDYVFLIEGLIGLHRADGNKKWLERADLLQQKQNELFWDEKAGGYFFTSDDHESLLARAKRPADNATPSGNSVSVHNLLYLSKQLDNAEYLEKAKKTFDSVSNLLADQPSVTPRLLETIDEFVGSK